MFGRDWKRSVTAVILAVVSVGCSSLDGKDVRQTEQLQNAIPNTGFVPYPIVTKIEDDEVVPDLAPDGSFQPAWDGSVADLLAADAYADCTFNSSIYVPILPDLIVSSAGTDAYLQHLLSKMGQLECEPFAPGPFNTIVQKWVANRESGSCNVDPQTGTSTHLEFSIRAENQYATFPEVFYDNDEWLEFTDDDFLFIDAFVNAGGELDYADLNLCMAQRLRSQMNGGQSLFTPSQDLLEILAVIRERAQLAILNYSSIAKVFSSDGPVPTEIVDEEYDFLALIRHWAEEVNSEVLQTTGEDFASAIRLYLEATYELARMLERQAATRPINDVGFDRAARDWEVGQPRIRLMNLLYGGDPIGSPDLFAPQPGRSRGGVGRAGILPAYVKTDMQDPRVGTLLGLARAQDALLMKVEEDDDLPVGFDAGASAERMYRGIEVSLRAAVCEIETPEDPACDPENIEPTLPELTEINEYALWQDHRVDFNHALSLTQALGEAFGELVRELPTLPSSRDLFRHQDGKLHLLGNHQTELIEGDDWIHIDPDFGTAPFSGHEVMIDFAEIAFLPETILLGADPRKQGFVHNPHSSHPTAATDWEKFRNLGAVAALAHVREALVAGSEADAFATPFFAAASEVLPDIDRAIGARSVVMRPKRTTANVTCPNAPTETCQTFTQDFDSFPIYEVHVTTLEDDPMDRLTTPLPSAQLHSIALDPETVGFNGTDRSDLDGSSTISATTHVYSGYATGYEKRTFQYSLDDEPVRPVLLRGNDPESMEGEQVYMSLFGHFLRSAPSISDEGYATSSGGALNAIGQRAMSVLSYDWSRPAFDAFGLPVDWVPPADASLVGGAPGEPSYQYFLRSAKEAAQEATTAVQKAIDNLVEETLVASDLEVAEERASTIAQIETSALCGDGGTCDLEREIWTPERSSFTCILPLELGQPPGVGHSACELAVASLDRVLGQYLLGSEVMDVPTGVAPTFPAYAGSELQRVLVRQWNAKQLLQRVVIDAERTFKSAGIQMNASSVAKSAALAERDAARSEVEAALEELDLQDDQIQAQADQLQVLIDELNATVELANDVADYECDNKQFERAMHSGTTFSGVKSKHIHVSQEEGWEVEKADKKRSFNPGPFYAQKARCKDAKDHARLLNKTHEDKIAAQAALESALLATIATLTPLKQEALGKRKAAADRAYDAAREAYRAAYSSASAQMVAMVTQVQQAQGELLLAIVELDQIQLRAENAGAAANLERDLAAKQADVRFGLQRKFRSYDMWRARALLESARRLSVAARRAIESRLVVNLSDLQSPQAFVDAPAIWADDVYGTDLDAPAVVGLSAAPQIENAVYPNQLLDYVGNLERFVQGYTVTYPTSVAAPDTEVVTIPGPELLEQVLLVDVEEEDEEVIAVHESVEDVLLGDSSGWTFFCPEENQWLPHPGAGQVPLEERLATMCGDLPPTRMRYNFSLDPWARLDDAIATIPFTQRHNVRWRQLAVNLIGTGVRDCQLAPSPQQCFSESYLRFQFAHAGPAWAMNHSQGWRAFDLPSALIESGKALASEEWLDPVANSWNVPFVANVARAELFGRPVNGAYDLIIELTPDVRPERIEQVQLLIETDYWVRQQ